MAGLLAYFSLGRGQQMSNCNAKKLELEMATDFLSSVTSRIYILLLHALCFPFLPSLVTHTLGQCRKHGHTEYFIS